jgi:hypothetical protein
MMKIDSKLVPGARVGYAAKFLRDIGAFSGDTPQRRGTYLGPFKGMEKTHGRVQWDDIEHVIATGGGQYDDPEYVANVRKNGSLVALSAIAVVGSLRFVDNSI